MAQDQIPSASALEDFCKIAPFARIIELNAKGMTTLRAAAIASIVGLHPSLQVLRIRASQSPDADKELLDLETFEALWTGIALTKRLVTLK
ncbi:Hypothetical Protein FCC1311_104632 [Hondaea fermentalgiana]|uniref:Uncharacterized protein n=1 Tax=Hondaea fermentalgiana TaxID=2315210 RepID=A0A2R5GV89_9STRA|nr:Hypothetical Protein FCC1311_104632 [Hondaea fermentalgiana]|eukprot:GBG34239.1 Hypothetical Protein FCC1311_104632 [Hondaea fermentalgiana]